MAWRGSRPHPASGLHAPRMLPPDPQAIYQITSDSWKADTRPSTVMRNAGRCSAGCSSKVVLLEFAAVRRGSQADLACEEAPEAAMHLEPLPSPRRSLSDAMRHCCFSDAPAQPLAAVSADASPSPRGKLSTPPASQPHARSLTLASAACARCWSPPPAACCSTNMQAACGAKSLHHAGASVKHMRHGPDLGKDHKLV